MAATLLPPDGVDDPAAPPGIDESWWDHVDLRLGLLATGLFVVILAVHGLLPGQVYDNPAKHQLAGIAQCLAESPRNLLTATCPDLGIPVGAPQLSLLPAVVLAGLFATVPGFGADVAASLSLILWLAVSMAGAFALLRHLGAGGVASVLGAAIYLMAPHAIGLRGLGGTYLGVTLLPLFALADILVIEAVTRRRKVSVIALGGYALVRLVAAFMDGYTFVMSAVVGAVLVLAAPYFSGEERPSRRRWLMAVATVGLANVLAAVAYTMYVPGGSYVPSSIDQFRGSGADLLTIVAPSPQIWWARISGFFVDSSTLWGDGQNSRWNYLGWIGVTIAVVHVVHVVRRRRRPWVVQLAAAGAIAVVLSLGPSLKIDDRLPGPRPFPVTSEFYLMPPEAATARLPTQWVFENVPGIDTMRATHRWLAVTRMVVVVLATLALSELARRHGARTRAGAAVLAVVAFVEVLPDVPTLLESTRANHISREAFRNDAVAELVSLTEPGEIVLLLPTGNDYLSNVLVPEAGLRSYNVGGDKNVALAGARRPQVITALIDKGRRDDAARAFDTVPLDAVVLTNYSMRWDAYAWPPAGGPTPVPERYERLADDPRFTVEKRRWHTVIRPVADDG